VELVTNWPGLGRLTYDALVARDADLAAGCAVAAAAMVGLASIVADVALAAIDPRASPSPGRPAACRAGTSGSPCVASSSCWRSRHLRCHPRRRRRST